MIQDRPGVVLHSDGIARMLQSSEISDAVADVGYDIESIANTIQPKQVFDTRRRLVPTLSRLGGTSLRASAEVSTEPEHFGRITSSVDALQTAAKRARRR